MDRDGAAVRVLPPAVPLLTILAGVGLHRLVPIDVGFTLPGRALIGSVILAVAFFGFGLPAMMLFRRSGQDPNPWKPSPSVVERGPYRITRNPMYVQLVLACLGFAVLLMNVWILLLTPVCVWVLHRFAILPEEAYLERKFGETYLAYKRRVRRWL